MWVILICRVHIDTLEGKMDWKKEIKTNKKIMEELKEGLIKQAQESTGVECQIQPEILEHTINNMTNEEIDKLINTGRKRGDE